MTTTQTVGSGSGIIFNDTFESSCSQAYINCVISAENALRSLFTNNITLNLDFNASASGQSGFLATNSWPSWTIVNYAQLQNALASHHSTALSDLPASDPNPHGGNDWYLPEAYGRMLGLSSSTPTFDDTVTLNTSYNWSYGQDVIDTIEHEITEGAMGRVGGLGDQNGVWSTMDLFRFNSSGQHDYTDGRDGRTTYFSTDGGSTLSPLTFNNQYSGQTRVNTGDTADFGQQDVFGWGATGETNTFSQTDLQVMTALGWTSTQSQVDDYRGDTLTTGTIAAGGSVNANINFAGDQDWFRTTLTAGTTYWFSEEGSPTGQGTLPDSYLRVLSNDGTTVVASDDDSGAGFNSFIRYTPTVTGTYYVSAQAFGINTGTYRLSEQVADDYAGTPATTGAIAAGGSVNANINFAGDQDWFRTTLTAGTTYWFSEEGSPTGQGTLPDAYMRLLSNDGTTVVASDDDSGVGFNSLISYTPTVTGTYYVSAQAFGSNTGTYRLSEQVSGQSSMNADVALVSQYMAAGFSDTSSSGNSLVTAYTPTGPQSNEAILATSHHS
jgi:hypothetical protein